jgi:hypothetical protein
MTEKKSIRNHWLTIRLNDEEYEQLTDLFRQSVHRKISDYARRVVLKKPTNVRYRNVSIDDFLTDMIQLKKELGQLANNFNQAVHKLHTLERIGDFQQWIITNEQDKVQLVSKIDAIFSRINQLYNVWLQE